MLLPLFMIKWFDRTFDFEHNPYDLPALQTRLNNFPAKLEARMMDLHGAVLTTGKWSIKEHIGHLADLEPLWQGRLEDIINGEEELRVTDLQNTKTDLAGHNDQALASLLITFRDLRQQTMQLLDVITPADLSKFALHPRLKTPMRVTDHLLFVVEHDEHHLASIEMIIGSWSD
jgi:uncharacterized damage-inducible protein DinB